MTSAEAKRIIENLANGCVWRGSEDALRHALQAIEDREALVEAHDHGDYILGVRFTDARRHMRGEP